MMRDQMVIPGLESLMTPKPETTAKPSIRQEVAELHSRVAQLELDITLLQIQLRIQGQD